MDFQLTQYRALIKQILSHYAEIFNRHPDPDEETVVVFDEEHDHYFLHTIGWKGTKRVWNTTVYVRLRNGKFWIEIDWLEDGIATDLLSAGVPKENIVLAFHHPEIRPLTEFAPA